MSSLGETCSFRNKNKGGIATASTASVGRKRKNFSVIIKTTDARIGDKKSLKLKSGTHLKCYSLYPREFCNLTVMIVQHCFGADKRRGRSNLRKEEGM